MTTLEFFILGWGPLWIVTFLCVAIWEKKPLQGYFKCVTNTLKANRKYILVSMALSVLSAPYYLLIVKQRQIVSLQNKVGFKGFIDNVQLKPENVFVFASIRNTGPPSIAENFALKVHTIGNKDIFGVAIMDTNKVNIGYSNGMVETYDLKIDGLQNKCSTPIPNGGKMQGILHYRFSPPLDLKSCSVFTLYFSDVNGKEYQVDYNAGSLVGAIPRYYPGMDTQIH